VRAADIWSDGFVSALTDNGSVAHAHALVERLKRKEKGKMSYMLLHFFSMTWPACGTFDIGRQGIAWAAFSYPNIKGLTV
jgi:hypothetical protein